MGEVAGGSARYWHDKHVAAVGWRYRIVDDFCAVRREAYSLVEALSDTLFRACAVGVHYHHRVVAVASVIQVNDVLAIGRPPGTAQVFAAGGQLFRRPAVDGYNEQVVGAAGLLVARRVDDALPV